MGNIFGDFGDFLGLFRRHRWWHSIAAAAAAAVLLASEQHAKDGAPAAASVCVYIAAGVFAVCAVLNYFIEKRRKYYGFLIIKLVLYVLASVLLMLSYYFDRSDIIPLFSGLTLLLFVIPFLFVGMAVYSEENKGGK